MLIGVGRVTLRVVAFWQWGSVVPSYRHRRNERVLTTIRKALQLLNRDGLYRWVIILLVALVAAVFEMIGAFLVFLVVGLATSSPDQVEVPMVGNIRSLVPDLDDQSFLLWTLAAIAALFAVRGAVQIGATYLQARVAQNAGARISRVIIEGYLRSPYSLFLRKDSAELIRNGHQAVMAVVSRLFMPLIRIVVETLVILGILVAMAVVAPYVTVLTIFIVGVLGSAVLVFVQPRLHALGRTTHQLQGATLRTLQESFHGIRDVKALSAEEFFSNRYSRDRLKLAHAAYLSATLRQLPRTIIETGLITLVLLFLAVASSDASGSGKAVPIVAMFAYAGIRLLPSIQRLIAGFNDIRFSSAPLDDIYSDLQAAQDLRYAEADITQLRFVSEITMDHITFRYEEAEEDALTDINLSIRRGESVGICGPTGGGKTTLVDILTGLIEPTSGSVRIDEVDLRGYQREWLRAIGIVPQMGFLIDDTLLRNIALGVADDRIDHAAVRDAVQLAQLVDYVDSLPKGLDTIVGERGIRISGGQRQRVAIARALYRRPSVLIFDEGTSALDPVTESRLMKSVDALTGSHTVIVVAHRLSTIRNSSRIVYIDQGRLCGLGTYDELLETNPRFRDFATVT